MTGGTSAALTIRAFGTDDVPAVVHLWNASDVPGSRYPLSTELLREIVLDNPSARLGDAIVAVRDDVVVGFAYLTLQRLPDEALDAFRSRAHLQAVVVDPPARRGGIGRALVRALAAVAASESRPEIELGGGFFYLWPAAPTDMPDVDAFCAAIGVPLDVAEPIHDLRGDVSTIRLEERDRAAMAEAGVSPGPLRASERDALLDYLAREFGGEWWHDMRWALDAGMPPERMIVLRTSKGEIVGHARIHVAGDRPIGPPLFWAALRGARAGGLGPIGVAARLRGRGLGRALLVAALAELRAVDATDVVIDATTLLDFYGPLGFRPWMTFRSARAPTQRVLVATAARSTAGGNR